jgi:hypothetical protein
MEWLKGGIYIIRFLISRRLLFNWSSVELLLFLKFFAFSHLNLGKAILVDDWLFL